ncbi:MAG: ornithine carbamoyltransferase [Acidobacteriota bacterium]|jgi:ornithine carbamoyltransferase|nr:ornithine carbamoyltransferase [Acidobacteriota bacterium]
MGDTGQRDFLTLRDWPTADLLELLFSARALKAAPGEYSRRLDGKALALIFEKPSLRTRVSFEVGVRQLGGFAIHLTAQEINLGKREPIRDVAKNLERMVQGIMIRTFAHAVVEELAREAAIPVINGLTDFTHPCQAMADYLTILETKGDLNNVKIAYIGDGNNVAHSLIFGAARFGAHIAVATPEGYEPDAGVVAWAREHADASGGRIEVVRDPLQAAEAADVLYTDVWTSMGQEAENEKRQRDFAGYQIDDGVTARAKDDYVFMHCLPAHRGEEVSAGVIDSPHSVVFQQAENRLHAQKAVLVALMG